MTANTGIATSIALEVKPDDRLSIPTKLVWLIVELKDEK